MRGIVESATTSSRASLFNNTAVTTAQRPTINHSAEHVALQISPRAQCRVLPPDEFNGMILVLLPAYSVSFITTAATVSRNHANWVTKLQATKTISRDELKHILYVVLLSFI